MLDVSGIGDICSTDIRGLKGTFKHCDCVILGSDITEIFGATGYM